MDQTEQIYARHMRAIDRAGAGGTWIDRSACAVVLHLALSEQAEKLAYQPTADALCQLDAWLDANSDTAHPERQDVIERAQDAIRELQDRLTAELASNVELRQQLAGAINGRQAAQEEGVRLALACQGLETGLAAAQNEAAMLRQQRAALQDLLDLAEHDRAELAAKLGHLTDQHATAVAPASSNDNGHVTAAELLPQTTALSSAAQDYWIGMGRGAHTWRTLPKQIRLEMIQFVLSGPAQGIRMTMAEFDAQKPVWMPVASSLPKTFGCTWEQLPTVEGSWTS
jgi:hypothetical protein